MSRRILVADDSSTIQKVIKIAFARFDVDIVEAASYLEALTAVGRGAPELLVIDASLPGARGPDDYTKLTREAGGAPLLLLIGTYDAVDEAAFRTAGFQHFMKKPFDASDLVQVAEQLSGGSFLANPPPAPLANRAQHATVIHAGGLKGLNLPAPEEPSANAAPPLPPPPIDQTRKGRRVFAGGEPPPPPSMDLGLTRGGGLSTSNPPLPPPPLAFGDAAAATGDDDTNPKRAPAREPAPLPSIPVGLKPGSGGPGVELSLGEDSDYLATRRVVPGASAASSSKVEQSIETELPALVRQAVEDYCERHFKSLAREIIATELRRLADEKARHLVDN